MRVNFNLFRQESWIICAKQKKCELEFVKAFNGLLWATLSINKMDSIVALLDLQQGS